MDMYKCCRPTIFLMSFILMGVVSCSRKQKVVTQITEPGTAPLVIPQPISGAFSDEDKILFIGFKFIGNEEYIPISASVVGREIAVGRLRQEENHPSNEVGTIVIEMINSEGQTLKRVYRENPLIIRGEFVNAAGELQSRELKTKETEFTLRTMYPPGTTKLRVSSVHPGDNPLKLLAEFNLFE